MGLLNGFCSLMILLTINTVVLSPNFNPVAAQVDVKTCANGTMTKQCGESIRLRVAMNVGPPPTTDCCAQLVKVGKPCHDAYVQKICLREATKFGLNVLTPFILPLRLRVISTDHMIGP
ncbi:hypothetical protein CDL15_Pgr005003 [Punica granatum]|uniref:Prolamin-like domain-containing protein n=1 Tax=Punica granatum TaxID=22663 RepID=A0A218XS60_PUNGR|nr:hypothetical protein CDL15_Pgr005003 [Punica granatum]